ncbi:cytidine deaminase-like protein [Xylariaceae sp. FL1651]|nr:cytidine deaminase-like protein [Xylariaceae sp. FL1651]
MFESEREQHQIDGTGARDSTNFQYQPVLLFEGSGQASFEIKMVSIPRSSSSADPSAVESTCRDYGLTEAEFKELHTRCVAAKATAYCPYSQFRVGASLISTDGVYFNGANVENASYPVGTCAERVAFGKAVTEGHRKIKAVAVATDISPAASPCGMCRQFIREFCDLTAPIIMFDKDDNYVVMRLEEVSSPC